MYDADISTFWLAALSVQRALAALRASDQPMRKAMALHTPGVGLFGLDQAHQQRCDELAARMSFCTQMLVNMGYRLTE